MYAAIGATPKIEYIEMPAEIRDQLSVFHASRGRQPAARRLQRGLRAAGGRRAPLRHPVPRSRRPVPLSMLDFETRLASIGAADHPLHRRSDARRLRLWRGRAHFAGGAGAGARGQAQRGRRSAAPAMWRAMSLRSARAASSSGWSARRCPGATSSRGCKPIRLIEPSLVGRCGASDHRKVRFVSEHFSTHLLRADWEQAGPVSADSRGRADRARAAAIPRVGAVVLSDYAKGVLTPRVIARGDRGGKARGRAGDRRSEGARLCGLSRRDRDHAEPAGACRRDAARARGRCGDRRRGGRSSPAWSTARPCW